MNTKALAIGWVGLGGLVGAASAQVVSSGILHTPLGNVTDMSSVERRLTACCLGSSGEDGVEVQLHSLWGGGVGVDLSPLTGGAGREIRIRPRGWDGTIKGNLRVASNDDGTITNTVDFSSIGATGCIERQFDEFGFIIAEIYTPGPIWAGPTVPVCDPPLVPTVWYTSGGQFVWGCGYGNNLYGDPYPYTQRTVAPVLPPGIPVTLGVDAIDITGTDVGPLNVVDASLGTFGASSWGVGQALIAEGCTGSSDPCPPSETGLFVSNIGSSGEDGVAIDLGANAGSASLARGGGNCCRGHVIIMKAFDDEGQELSRVTSDEDPATGAEIFLFDFSGLGATQFEVIFQNSSGQTVGTELRPNGGGIRPGNGGLCPPGSREWWIQNEDFSWTFVGCLPIMDFAVLGGGTYADVASVTIRPVDAHSPAARSLRTIVTTASNVDSLTIYGVEVRPPCPGDLNGSGTVDLTDLSILLSNFGTSGGATLSDGDVSGDGNIDLTDLAMLLARFGSTCG
ncbi:MAG: hypothetical protein AMXMBFR47_12160 [Planctomycetota bacterium]